MTVHPFAPSGQGTVVLSSGAGVGALIVRAPGRLHGRDVEISPAGDPGSRTFAAVRPRYVRGGVVWSVVFDGLPEGRYVIWRDPVTPLAEVDVHGGRVTGFPWPEVTATAA